MDLLYCHAFARANVGNGLATTIVDSNLPCPYGVADGTAVRVVFRTYLEPGYATAPASSTLVRGGVILFKAR